MRDQDRHAAVPKFRLVNKDSLDKILEAEVFVNSDGQFRAAYIILGYKPISSSFQAPKCVIKAKDPCLHRISVAAPGFLLHEGASIPEGTLPTFPIFEGVPITKPPPQGTPDEAASSQPSNQEEDEETKKQKEVVEVSDFEDLYEAFAQPLSLEVSTNILGDFEESVPCAKDMGFQRKQRSTL
ncbi:hypothetical protein SO802_034504 [Lithocarpus litseifolius]|uniref:Uncharacterized protein n=1 Tax=Lithocarpus litseifolius TaxID=425828 RepID=A0AAW2BJG1_9ROSI